MTKNMGRAGWRPVRSEVRGEAAEEGAEMLRAVGEEDEAASGVDDRVFASSAKSFRLEGTAENPAAAAKRFSLPERIPYCVSAEPFAIVAAGEAMPAETGVVSPREDASESRRQKRWEGEPGGGTRRSAARRETALRRPEAGPVRDEPAETGEEMKLLAGVPAAGAFYVYSFDGRLLAEYDVSGVLVRDYVYFGGQLIAEFRNAGGQLFYYASDQIGSTRIVTDGSGTVVYAAAHEPYGGIQKTWTSAYDPMLKFSGKPRDPESELDYFGARYYDRRLYRFLSVDPVIGGSSSDLKRWNLYAYCGNNPVKYIDPDGRTYIIFVKQEQKLYVFGGDDWFWGAYDASNNPSGNKPFPNGKWKFKAWNPHPNAHSWDSIDQLGFIAFDFGDQTEYQNYGLHSGRDMSFDRAFRWYWRHATDGCIRTTRDAMMLLTYLHFFSDDPITHIIVVDKIDATVTDYYFSDKEQKQTERDAASMRSYFNMMTDYFFFYGPIPPGAQ